MCVPSRRRSAARNQRYLEYQKSFLISDSCNSEGSKIRPVEHSPCQHIHHFDPIDIRSPIDIEFSDRVVLITRRRLNLRVVETRQSERLKSGLREVYRKDFTSIGRSLSTSRNHCRREESCSSDPIAGWSTHRKMSLRSIVLDIRWASTPPFRCLAIPLE